MFWRSLNLSVLFAVLLNLVVVTGQSTDMENEEKGSGVFKLCGEDFLREWKKCCGGKCEPQKRFLNPSTGTEQALYSESDAKRFLRPSLLWRRVMTAPSSSGVSSGDFTDAVEECCIEGCDLHEVSEYPCV